VNGGTPKNLAMDVAIEAGELMELFVWCTTQESDAEAQKNKNEVECFFCILII